MSRRLVGQHHDGVDFDTVALGGNDYVNRYPASYINV